MFNVLCSTLKNKNETDTCLLVICRGLRVKIKPGYIMRAWCRDIPRKHAQSTDSRSNASGQHYSLSPLRKRVRELMILGNTIPSPLAGEGQGTGSTAVSLFPLPLRERVRERGEGMIQPGFFASQWFATGKPDTMPDIIKDWFQ
jgi:hypothetical protein